MKRVFYLIFISFYTGTFFNLNSQAVIKNTAISGVCYAGTNVNRIYIPPPERPFYKTGSKGNKLAKVTIYPTGFTTDGLKALAKAETILESMLPPDADITILANYTRISTAGVLGFSSSTGFVGGWAIDAWNPINYYPVALAEKILGQKLNSDENGDITLTINNTTPWYFGTDGNTPTNKYDLVTVVLHELLHGLGFFDSMEVNGTLGSYNSIPLIYDNFVENLAGNRLTDSTKFVNNSGNLKDAMTGGQLYFKGPVLTKFAGTRAQLYAPVTFDPGSSIAHLDETTTSIENSLMTPYVALGEAIHNPGTLTFSILGDLGWINTRIVHDPPRDTEEHFPEIELSANIISDTTYNRNNIGLVYSYDEFSTFDTIYLTSPAADDIFKTKLSVSVYNKELQYYFFAEDYFKRIYRSPSLISNFRYSIYIGEDTVKPLLAHTKADYYLEKIDTIKLEIFADDNIGMDSVYIEYKVNDGSSTYIGVNASEPGKYDAIINARKLILNGGDSIHYRIFGVDTSMNRNTAILPKTGYFSVGIEDISSVVESYKTSFVNAANDFLNVGFTISNPSLFTGMGLHTKHPYESPELSAPSIEYTSMLRHPLKMNGSGMLITYNEIVLVEPGEVGAPFGSADFYDYVVLDGSSDFGKTWFTLIDGYDSRINSAWEVAYTNSVVDQISTTSGDESMLKKHTIFYKPSQNISTGDTLLLRFRLYSDPYANGWGWVIEDLSVSPLIDGVEDIRQNGLLAYPNPGNGIINVRFNSSETESIKPVRYSVFNMTGTCLINNLDLDTAGNLINISGYPEGFYIIVLYMDDGIKTIRYSLIR